jgi:hypothetical protein
VSHAHAQADSLSGIPGSHAEYRKKNVRSIFCCAQNVGVYTEASAPARKPRKNRKNRKNRLDEIKTQPGGCVSFECVLYLGVVRAVR